MLNNSLKNVYRRNAPKRRKLRKKRQNRRGRTRRRPPCLHLPNRPLQLPLALHLFLRILQVLRHSFLFLLLPESLPPRCSVCLLLRRLRLPVVNLRLPPTDLALQTLLNLRRPLLLLLLPAPVSQLLHLLDFLSQIPVHPALPQLRLPLLLLQLPLRRSASALRRKMERLPPVVEDHR